MSKTRNWLTPKNYLYNNTVEDISISPTSRGYTLASSPETGSVATGRTVATLGINSLMLVEALL